MSPAAGAGAVATTAVAAAIEPYRAGLADDAGEFTLALLKVAKSNVNGAGFNVATPADAAALQVLAHWRRDAKRVLDRVEAVGSEAPGRRAAKGWLTALIAALDEQRQAFALADPEQAAGAARSARKNIEKSHRLQAQLERALA
jgi:hypothetical protein